MKRIIKYIILFIFVVSVFKVLNTTKDIPTNKKTNNSSNYENIDKPVIKSESFAEKIHRESTEWALIDNTDQEKNNKLFDKVNKYVAEGKIDQVVEILSELAEQKNTIAMFNLGMFYIGTDKQKGKEYLNKAAILGNIQAQTKIMFNYYEIAKQIGDNDAKQEILTWAKKVSENDYAQVQYLLIQIMLENKNRNCDDIKYWADRSVKKGIWWDNSSRKKIGNYPPLQYFQASLRLHEICYPSNEQEIFSWALKAAKQEYPEAEALVGICFVEGKGVKEDLNKGAEWLVKAYSHGNMQARELLQQVQYRMMIKQRETISKQRDFNPLKPKLTYREAENILSGGNTEHPYITTTATGGIKVNTQNAAYYTPTRAISKEE